MSSIKEYFINENEVKEKQEVAPVIKAMPQIQYEVVTVSGPDFVVRRKTKKSSSLMVILPSQMQYYIKNEKTNEIVSLDVGEYVSFTKDMKDDLRIQDENGTEPFWTSILPKGAKKAWGFVTLVTWDKFCEYATQNLVSVDWESDLHRERFGLSIYNADINNIKKILPVLKNYITQEDIKDSLGNTYTGTTKLTTLFDNLFSNSFYCYRSYVTFNVWNAMYSRWGIDGIRQIVEAYMTLPISRFPSPRSINKVFTANTDNCKVEYNLKDFVEYLFHSSYEQGYGNEIDNFCDSWSDYLSMQLSYYGEIRKKYSNSIASDEKKLAYSVGQMKLSEDNKKFMSQCDFMKDFEFRGKTYSILAPKKATDLIDEGRMQSNCLSGYVDRVEKGQCFIFFMRRNDSLDKSLVSIEVREDGTLGQVKGRFNKQPKYEELDFVRDWHRNYFLPKFTKSA